MVNQHPAAGKLPQVAEAAKMVPDRKFSWLDEHGRA
jgi:hypothetical protein